MLLLIDFIIYNYLVSSSRAMTVTPLHLKTRSCKAASPEFEFSFHQFFFTRMLVFFQKMLSTYFYTEIAFVPTIFALTEVSFPHRKIKSRDEPDL